MLNTEYIISFWLFMLVFAIFPIMERSTKRQRSFPVPSSSSPSPSPPKRLFLVAHLGAGKHKNKNKSKHEALLRSVLKQGLAQWKAGLDPAELVAALLTQLEDSGIANAGRGSNAIFGGGIETDACIAQVDSMRTWWGAVGAAKGATNPAAKALSLLKARLAGNGFSCDGKTLPTILTGISEDTTQMKSSCTTTKAISNTVSSDGDMDDDDVSDTVGVALLSSSGFAAGASSGGASGRPSGRIGAAAVPGAAVSLSRSGAVLASGSGDSMVEVGYARSVHEIGANFGLNPTDYPHLLIPSGVGHLHIDWDSSTMNVYSNTPTFVYGSITETGAMKIVWQAGPSVGGSRL